MIAARAANGRIIFPSKVPNAFKKSTVGANASFTSGPMISNIRVTIVVMKFKTFCPFSRAEIALITALMNAASAAMTPPIKPPFINPCATCPSSVFCIADEPSTAPLAVALAACPNFPALIAASCLYFKSSSFFSKERLHSSRSFRFA